MTDERADTQLADGRTGEAPAPPPLPAPRLAPRDGFTRELTPTWLSTAALLAGQEPPDLTRPFRYLHLGCGNGDTAAVVAANHPDAEVWAWDRRAEPIEATRRLRDAAGLANLVVHERPGLPADLGGALADFVVVHDVLAAADDELRARIMEALRAALRPGGLVCVTAPTLVGWSEIAPVQALMRRVALDSRRDLQGSVPEVLDLLVRLRDGGAAYLTERPAVKAWLDDLLTLDPSEVAERYLRDQFRPMSPAQVHDLLADAGCRFVGSARLTDDLDLDLPPELAETMRAVPSRVLQETYRDLAGRRTYRLDVFRLGAAPLGGTELAARMADLEVTGIAVGAPCPAAADPDGWQRLQAGVVPVGELAADAGEAARLLRVLMETGHAHPVAAGGMSPAVVAACAALNAEWSRMQSGGGPGVLAAPLIASAIPLPQGAEHECGENALLARLGVR